MQHTSKRVQMPDAERVLIADKLRLALDEIETGAADAVSINATLDLNYEIIRIAGRRLDRMEVAA